MRFIEVKAVAFGPFQNRSLSFREGFNIFWGKNEAGKSSWHAALYAGLCGLRRTVGRSTEKEEFKAAHKPWESDYWQVDLLLELGDGQKVQIHQDLANLMNSSAFDADLGRECCSEIMFENCPDGALWLGLDRHTFPNIACVKQTEVLKIQEKENAEALQQCLQRAADTMGGDSTAAQALALLNTFKKEQVGKDQRNSTRPLRLAVLRLEAARETIEKARFAHREYLGLLEDVSRREGELEKSHRDCRLLEARKALLALRESRKQLDRIRELFTRFPDGEPPRMTRDQDLAERVVKALDAWERRPDLPDLSGMSAEQLRQDLASLPKAPSGDLEPSSEFLKIENDYRLAKQSLEYHLEKKPGRLQAVEAGGATLEEIGDWIRALSKPEPPVDKALRQRREELTDELNRLGKPGGSWVRAIPGLAPVVVGVVLILLQWLWVGLALLAVGIFWASWALLKTDDSHKVNLQGNLLQVEKELGSQQFRWNQWSEERKQAEEDLRRHNLPVEPSALTERQNQLKRFLEYQQELDTWTATESELRHRLDSAVGSLLEVLRERGVTADPSNPVPACEGYREACRERAQLTQKASRRADLEKQLSSRMELEQAAARAEKRREDACASLLTVAGECGIDSSEESQVVPALEAWQRERRIRIEKQEKTVQEWAELNELLHERSLETLQEEFSLESQEVEGLSEGFSEEELDVSGLSLEVLRPRLKDAAEMAVEAEKELASARTSVRERQRRLVPVSEAEEELESAEAELARVRELEDTLGRTIQFLERAQDRVHRNIAPRLAGSVRKHLASVTAGRYVDVRVDPETLLVTVQEASGAWREAIRLSHGTAEQVYLLLRLALAEHLTKQGEVCPLILDDVTVQSDTERTQAILDALLGLSRTRQVILFSQEDEVKKWAEERLAQDGMSQFVELTQSLVMTP